MLSNHACLHKWVAGTVRPLLAQETAICITLLGNSADERETAGGNGASDDIGLWVLSMPLLLG